MEKRDSNTLKIYTKQSRCCITASSYLTGTMTAVTVPWYIPTQRGAGDLFSSVYMHHLL